jgi:LacI family transcriptional regulator
VSEPTIRDVARRAGVSVATVSRVLNGQAVVSETTRQRVLTAISELGYNPNGLARGLARRRSLIVGVIVPDIANPFFAEVARGMGDEAARHGYQLTLANSDLKREKETAYIHLFREQRVDGLIYTSGHVDADLLAVMEKVGRPYALAATWHPQAPSVLIDSYAGARLAMRHLLELGHRRIGILDGTREDPISGGPRAEGYRDEAAAWGVAIDPDLTADARFDPDLAYREAARMLSLPHPPTALVAASDLMAVGAMGAALDRGLRLPDDLSVVGFDNIALTTLVRPRLTTVAQPMYQIGARAMRRLAEAIEAAASGEAPPDAAPQDGGPLVEWIAPELVVRESTAPPRRQRSY